MSKDHSVTLELTGEQYAWLQQIAERANLEPAEVLRLQLVAQAHASDLAQGGTAALPGLRRDTPSAGASGRESGDQAQDSVMDMLSSARDRLNKWEERRETMEGKIPRLEALRRRLEDIGADTSRLNLGPEQTSSSTTLIQQAMSRIRSVEAAPTTSEEEPEDAKEATSMFELAEDPPGSKDSP